MQMTREKINQLMSCCTLCPRKCRADRLNGSHGFCGQGADVMAARAALHFWEEPCISGGTGAGTVFFSGCTLGCVFCQNRPISREHFGKALTPDELYAVFGRLADQGAACIELVTPTHFTHALARVLVKRTAAPDLAQAVKAGGFHL